MSDNITYIIAIYERQYGILDHGIRMTIYHMYLIPIVSDMRKNVAYTIVTRYNWMDIRWILPVISTCSYIFNRDYMYLIIIQISDSSIHIIATCLILREPSVREIYIHFRIKYHPDIYIWFTIPYMYRVPLTRQNARINISLIFSINGWNSSCTLLSSKKCTLQHTFYDS